MKNYLYFASITLNLCPISIAKMCFVHFRYMYNCRKTCHATMGPELSWSSIACFYYRILRFMPGPSVGPNINLNDFMTVMDYSIFFWMQSIFSTELFWTWIKKQNSVPKSHFWSSPKYLSLSKISFWTFMPIPSASSNRYIFLTMFKCFWLFSIVFEYVQIFLTILKYVNL